MINQLCQSQSPAHRIIVTSTDSFTLAHADGANNWAFFSESFWGDLAAGGTIGNTFVAGCQNVMACGDGAVQFPLLNDNGDGEGAGPFWLSFPPEPWITTPPFPLFPNQDQGYDADMTFIHGPNTLTLVSLPIILATARNVVVSATSSIPVWAKVNNDSLVGNLIAVLQPATWSPPSTGTPDANGLFPLLLDNSSQVIISLIDQTGSGNYTGQFAPPVGTGEWSTGLYRIEIIPQGTDGGVGSVVTESATVTQNGSAPQERTPPAVIIVNPAAGDNLNGTTSLVAIGDDAVGLKSVSILIDGKQVANMNYTSYPYQNLTATFNTTEYSNGPHQITAIATNIADLNATEAITVIVKNPSTNYTGLVDVGVFAIGFVAGVVVIVIVRVIRKPRGGRPVAGNISWGGGVGDASSNAIKVQEKWIKDGSSTEFKFWAKGASPNSASGEMIKPMKPVVRPNTGKSVQLPKGNTKALKVDDTGGEEVKGE
jgi:hypothetical protein